MLSLLSEGFVTSLLIFALTLLFSMPLGLAVMFGRRSRLTPLRGFIKAYISIMRGTPLMLQLLFVYYGLPFIPGIGIRMDDFQAAIFAFVLNYAAYFCEIFRAGIQAIPKGQYEAARTLGMNYVQTMRRIILPQVFRIILPPVSNETITLVKDTSLAFAIAYTEMFTMAKQIASAQASLMPLFIAGLFYYIFNFVVAFVMEAIEKKLDYFK